MKKKKRQSLEKKLKAYSAAAAGTLLLAPSVADAAIQYSGLLNLAVNNNTSQVVDLDGDGNNEFWIGQATGPYWSWMPLWAYGTYPSYSIRVGKINDTYNNDPANLPSNYPILNNLGNPAYYWNHTASDTLAGVDSYTVTYYEGNFVGSRGYLGVRFRNAGCNNPNWHYGWIQLDYTNAPVSGIIVDWAYEDTCNTPILAGDIVGAPAISVPTLSQWGILILIALLAGAGTLMLRKREESS